MLEAAGGNPLEAQRMDAELRGEWWDYYLLYREVRAALSAKARPK